MLRVTYQSVFSSAEFRVRHVWDNYGEFNFNINCTELTRIEIAVVNKNTAIRGILYKGKKTGDPVSAAVTTRYN